MTVIEKATMSDFTTLKLHDVCVSEKELEHSLKNGRITVARYNGNFAGWLRYNLFWDNTPFMNMLFVLPNYRSMGIGTQLVINWENELAAKGYKTFLLSTPQNESSQHFYRKLGYNECGSFTLNCEPTELIMTKNI